MNTQAEVIEQREKFIAARYKEIQARENGLRDWMKLREILEVKWETEWPDGDIVIRVKRSRALKAPMHEVTPEMCEVTVE